jgi:hypothetical protein
MRSECIAAAPQSACCYTWKLPVTPHMRPVLFEQAHSSFERSGAKRRREVCRAEHPSIPWKAYLASREFQNLASDLADGVFAPASCRQPCPDAERPMSLAPGGSSSGAATKAPGGLLAPVLSCGAGLPPDNAKKQALRFAMAA